MLIGLGPVAMIRKRIARYRKMRKELYADLTKPMPKYTGGELDIRINECQRILRVLRRREHLKRKFLKSAKPDLAWKAGKGKKRSFRRNLRRSW
jgi:hypothetical protein